MSSNNVNRTEKRKISLFKKMFMQLAICAVIYIIFYLIKNTNYIFSEDVINKTKEFLSHDINFGHIQSQVSSFINDNKDKLGFLAIFGESEENVTEVNSLTNTVANETNDDSTNAVGGIGGAETDEIIEDDDNKEKKTQSELDIEYIKKNFEFDLPLKGSITSRYGKREATEVVSANHQGIDLGADEGTAIYAAMDGTVEVASGEGEYGKHLDIVNNDVLTRYAHCSKLLVKKGEKVKKGQKIAEVGSTGNSTGPHLHFEIRRDNRTVNPEAIIEF